MKAAATFGLHGRSSGPNHSTHKELPTAALIQQRRNDESSPLDLLHSAPDRHRRGLQLPNQMIETSSRTDQLRLPRLELGLRASARFLRGLEAHCPRNLLLGRLSTFARRQGGSPWGEPARTGRPLHGHRTSAGRRCLERTPSAPGTLEIIRAYEEWKRVSVAVDPLRTTAGW